jgi:hypothetical protein
MQTKNHNDQQQDIKKFECFVYPHLHPSNTTTNPFHEKSYNQNVTTKNYKKCQILKFENEMKLKIK